MEERIDIVERLNRELFQKEKEKEELEYELDSIKNFKDNSWMLNETIKNDFELPLPRIEMRFREKEYHSEWIYGIVFNPFWENEEVLFLPIGKTTTSQKEINLENEGSFLPFRDGLHIKHDSLIFKLPAFFIDEENNVYKEIIITDEIKEHIERVKQWKK